MSRELKADFPILEHLTDVELDDAIRSGGLSLALTRARIKKLTSKPTVGRPATAKKTRKVIQRRGRIPEKKISPYSSNVQLAKLASIMQKAIGGSITNAVRLLLKEGRYEHTASDVRKVAKLASELTAIENDKAIRMRQAVQLDETPTADTDTSLLGQLKRANRK